MCVRVCVRACARVSACVCVCFRACVCACVHACVRACARECDLISPHYVLPGSSQSFWGACSQQVAMRSRCLRTPDDASGNAQPHRRCVPRLSVWSPVETTFKVRLRSWLERGQFRHPLILHTTVSVVGQEN